MTPPSLRAGLGLTLTAAALLAFVPLLVMLFGVGQLRLQRWRGRAAG